MIARPTAVLDFTKDEINTNLDRASTSGLMKLLYSDETLDSEINDTLAESTIKGTSIAANSYISLIIKCIIRLRQDKQAAPVVFTLKIKEGTTVHKTFDYKIFGADGAGQTIYANIDCVINGGQSGATNITVTGQMDTQHANIGMRPVSMSIYATI